MKNIYFQLGYQLNLIKGIKWNCNLKDGMDIPFFAPNASPLLTCQDIPTVDNSQASFNQIKISFLYSWDSLIEEMYSRWHITDSLFASNITAYVLKQPDEDKINAGICNMFGIENNSPENKEIAYALVTVTKSVGQYFYEMDGKESLKSKLSELPDSATDAAPFLDFFNQYGTHYVDAVEMGDMMYQLFVYDKETLHSIEARFETSSLTGPMALAFQQYTQLKNECGGYAKDVGNLCLISEHPAFESMKEKFEDGANWLDCSIFAAIKKENSTLLKQLDSVVLVSCNLASIFTCMDEGKSTKAWSDLLNCTLYQKYLDNIKTEFAPLDTDYNYADIYHSFQQSFVTTVSTSVVTLNQLWVVLDKFVTINPENVKKMFVFADVIELFNDMNLPGEEVIIICRKFIAHNDENKALTLSVTDNGYTNFKFYCQESVGVMKIEKKEAKEHKVIEQGQALKTIQAADGQLTVDFDKSHTQSPPLELLRQTGDRASFLLGLPLQAAQSIISCPVSRDAYAVAMLFVQWLADILEPVTEDEPDLVNIRFRAILLLKSANNIQKVMTVPLLTYEAYKPAIDKMMDAVDAFDVESKRITAEIQENKRHEETYKGLTTLNTNVLSIGEYLLEANKVMGNKETDVQAYHKKVAGEQQEMLKKAEEKVKDLELALIEQQDVMKEAEGKLKTALGLYIFENTLKSIIQLAEGLALLYSGIGGVSGAKSFTAWKKEDGNKQLTRIKFLMERIDSVIKVIQGVNKSFDAVDSTVHTIIKGTKDLIEIPEVAMLTELEWTEFDAEVYAIMAPVLTTVPYANTYLKEAKILSARGRAYIDANSQVSKMNYDIELNIWQEDISEKQSQRLKELEKVLKQSELSPQRVNEIDLFEMGNILQSHSQNIILQLVQTLSIQDAALQYYYLQYPSQINSYDLLSLKEVMVSQAQNSILALESFPSKPSNLCEPFVFKLEGVHVSELMDDKAPLSFTIPMDVPFLFNYVRVRILEIKMKIDGVESTDSGNLNIRLDSDAHPFSDRGLEREKIDYISVPQSFEYVYKLATGECVYNNKPSGEFAQYYMQMTPFTCWRISLPMGERSENEGIRFSGETVDIMLSFNVQAIRLSNKDWTTFNFNFLQQNSEGNTKDELLNEMNGRTITNGWDVVCAMSAEHISSLFADKYNKKENVGTLYQIKDEQSFETGSVVFDFNVGAPFISFIKDDPTRCQFRIEIKSGKAELKDINGKVLDKYTQVIPAGPDDGNKYYITCIVPLAILKGRYDSEDVVLNFEKTESVHIDLKFSDFITEYVRNALKIFFCNNLAARDWSLGKLIYKQNIDLIDLTPTHFYFSTSVDPSQTNDLGCLMLFITLTEGQNGNAKELLADGNRIFTPYPKGKSAALIISSRVLYEKILYPQYKANFSENIIVKEGDKKSYAYELACSGNLDCGRYDDYQNQNLLVPLDGFHVRSNVNNMLEVNWTEEFTNKVQYKHSVYVAGEVFETISDGKVTLNISVDNPTYKFNIEEPSQKIVCTSSMSVNVSGKEPSFWDGKGFSHAKKMVKDVVSRNLSSILKFQLKGISVFAVSNLLFPSDHIITYGTDQIFIPGDLIIWGETKQKL